MELAAKLALKPLAIVVTMAASKLSAKVLKDDWASKFQPQLEKIDAGINALRTKELKAAKIHFDLARIRLGHDLKDESARQELETAKREAVKALGIVSKVKEQIEVIELILTVEILLFLNLDYPDDRHFLSTRDQCLYFLRKLKEIPQVFQYLDIELKGAFSMGTFRSERMWLLLEVLRMDVDVLAFFLSYIKQRQTLSVSTNSDFQAENLPELHYDDVHASFQSSMKVLFVKSKDSSWLSKKPQETPSFEDLLRYQLGHYIDLYCLTKKADYWVFAKNLAALISEEIKDVSAERIQSLLHNELSKFERKNDNGILEAMYGIELTTGITISLEVIARLVHLQEQKTQEFLNGGDPKSLQIAALIGELFGLVLAPSSEVVPEVLSHWSNMFVQFDENGISASLWCIPLLITIYGSSDLLEGREKVFIDNVLDSHVCSSSSSKGYEPRNVFISEKGPKWMSAELKAHPFHEWISAKFEAPTKLIAFALKSTPHLNTAPTEVSLEGRDSVDGDWRTLMKTKSVQWRRNGWKMFVVDELSICKELRFNFFENAQSDRQSGIVSLWKMKCYV